MKKFDVAIAGGGVIGGTIALHHGLGLRAEALRAEDARELEPALSEEAEAAALRPDEASVDNRALMAAILEAAQHSGAQIFSGNGAKAIWREKNRCAGLILQNEKVEAQWTIIAAGCFSAAIEGVAPYAPVRPAKGQMGAPSGEEWRINGMRWSEEI